MSNINQLSLSGNLTRDPKLSATDGGTPVLQLNLAFNDRSRNTAGEWEESANYIDATLFGNRANGLAQILAKGSKVFITGKLRYSSWVKDGVRNSKHEVIITEIELGPSPQH